MEGCRSLPTLSTDWVMLCFMSFRFRILFIFSPFLGILAWSLAVLRGDEMQEFDKAQKVIGWRDTLAYVHVRWFDLSPGAIGNWQRVHPNSLACRDPFRSEIASFSTKSNRWFVSENGGARAGTLFWNIVLWRFHFLLWTLCSSSSQKLQFEDQIETFTHFFKGLTFDKLITV